jgi:thiamine biosynthesis lipoprotein
MEAEARFRAMGSDVHVVVVGGSLPLLDVARDAIEDLEARWSRFRSDSEVSRLNDLAGLPVHVSAATRTLVERALIGARITEGRFDPTVLGSIHRAGYDRSFELRGDETPHGRSTLMSGWEDSVIDRERSTVTLPKGTGFDPGGVGKGLAADLVCLELLRAGAAGACVNVGGDLRVEGEGPNGGSWVVAIEHPLMPGVHEDVVLSRGAVASTTRVLRAWGPSDDRRHHLIDPGTGEPAMTGLAGVTVIAAEAWQAEVLTKGAFVAGLSEGLYLLASTGVEGLLMDDHGCVYPTYGFDRYVAHRGEPAGSRGAA